MTAAQFRALRLAPELPLTPELQTLLDERLADVEAHPDAFRPWDEVKDELLGKYLS